MFVIPLQSAVDPAMKGWLFRPPFQGEYCSQYDRVQHAIQAWPGRMAGAGTGWRKSA